MLIGEGHRFRGLTLTLGPEAKNQDIGRYWHRFRMSLKKAGDDFQYIWIKEFQENGKLHLHALITAFIPWNAIKYYWRLATKGTSYIVWIAKAQVQHTAAYIAKYITKDLTSAPFRKGERRYSMSKGIRKIWPLLKSSIDGSEKTRYEFTYKPDNSNILKKAIEAQQERKCQRKKWQAESPIKDNGKINRIYKTKPRHKPKHNKSNIVKLSCLTI
jgi:hypothetical protein